MAGEEKTATNREKKTATNRNINYIFSYDDLLALNKLMTYTYGFDLSVTSERGMGTHKKFSIFAPSLKDNTWYRGEGFSIEKAFEDWLVRV